MTNYELSGKVALVTGGARGIGFATARALRGRGAHVAIVDLHQEDVDRAVSELGGDSAGFAADVTDRMALQRVVAQIVERFGGLDVVMANAGVANRPATMRAMPTETFERVLDVNVFGVVRTVEAALPEIVRRGGHVVVVASAYAFMNGAGASPYAMSKAAVEQLGRALRVELARHGAGASVAYFGFIDTEMVRRALDADPLADRLGAAIPGPLRKRLRPEQAAAAVVRGIERRQGQIIVPRRWYLLSVLRGALSPLLDARMVRDARVQELVAAYDERTGDLPTTA